MLSITEILAQELGQKKEYIDNIITLLDEATPFPSLLAIGRKCTVPWTTLPCAIWRPV